MAQAAILFRRATKPVTAFDTWLARAERARRIAMELSARDAEVLAAYAAECEAEAWLLGDEFVTPIAA
jgi:hypothetical protein